MSPCRPDCTFTPMGATRAVVEAPHGRLALPRCLLIVPTQQIVTAFARTVGYWDVPAYSVVLTRRCRRARQLFTAYRHVKPPFASEGLATRLAPTLRPSVACGWPQTSECRVAVFDALEQTQPVRTTAAVMLEVAEQITLARWLESLYSTCGNGPRIAVLPAPTITVRPLGSSRLY